MPTPTRPSQTCCNAELLMLLASRAGERVLEKPFDALYDATWLPPLPGTTYEDRPPSPERIAAAGKAGAATGAAASSNGAAKPAAAYR